MNSLGKRTNRLGMDQTDLSLLMRRYGIGLVLVAMCIFLMIATPNFTKATNLLSILNSVAVNGCIAFGMCVVITGGGIDLSVGSMLALGSVMIGKMLDATGSNLIACVVCIAVCTFFGLINGLLLAKFELFPFVVTLATQLSIRGIGYLISGGYSQGLTNVSFTNIGIGKTLGIPNAVFFLTAILIITYILMHRTKFGRYDYAVGGNKAAATASGVPVFWTVAGSYVFSGFCTGVAAVLMSARINAAQPNIGIGYETDAIAACVIGGTSFAGGISTTPGCLIGILMIGVIYNGMNLLGVNSYWQTILKGLLILLALLLDKFMNKKH